MRAFHRTVVRLTLVLGFFVSAAATAASAQSQLAPAITVNDRVITQYELNQRKRLLEVFRTPGNLDEQAREALIEDRLKEQEISRTSLSLSDDALNRAMEDFAGRADMNLTQFTAMLSREGVDIVTLEDFVRVGTTWRDYVRARFSRQVTVTESDVDRAIARQGSGGTEIEVLLSEIIIPAPPERAADARRVAQQIAQMRSYSEFENAARQVSALPTREDGGRLGWVPLTNYPPQLRSILLDLRPGEVTDPIDITNGVALFQKRGVREASRPARAPASIDFATYAIPGGNTAAARARAADVADQLDTCDDLYGVARDQPAQVLQRDTLPPNQIPDDIALELARLDAGELSFNLTRDDGNTLLLVMLCGRTAVGQEGLDRDTVRNQIRSQRLGGLANALIADLRASATIIDR